MNQWYRKTLTKIVVLLTGVLSGAAFVTSLATAMTFAGTVNPAEITRLINEPYEESPDFNSSVDGMMWDVFRQFQVKNLFETDGAYNPDKVIDIMEYAQTEEASGENVSGIAYTLSQLEAWGEKYYNGGDSSIYAENDVVVCRRLDGSYYYYYLEDFIGRFERGELFMQFTDTMQNQEGFLRELQEGTLTDSGGYKLRIYNSEGEELYTDCWNFGDSLREEYAPQGAAGILDVVNNSSELNGRLTEIYENIGHALTSIYEGSQNYDSGWAYLEEGNTNFTYLYIDNETRQVYTNKEAYEDYAGAEEHLDEMKSGDSVKYMIIQPRLKDFETNMDVNASGEWNLVRAYDQDEAGGDIFAVAVDTSYPIQDQFYEASANYNDNVPFLRGALILLIAGGILFLVSAVWIAITAGKVPGNEEIHLTAFDRWKTEIAAAIVILIWAGATLAVFSMGFSIDLSNAVSSVEYYAGEYTTELPLYFSGLFTEAINVADLTGVFAYGLFTFLCFFAGYVSLIRRIKAKRLWRGSLVYAVLSFTKKVFTNRFDTFKTGVLTLAFIGIQILAILIRNAPMLFVSLLADAAVLWLVLSSAIAKGRIRKGIEEIASGNLEYRIDLNGLRGTERDIAEKINDIGGGLNRAVDEAMRNERLKTDLITNVSHDIKTPLTSIINYVDILKRSNISDEKIRGYLDILEAKAQRLKILTEDVVEASKVSSGNITLEYMDMDLRELVQQTEGEMAEKFTARNLTVVLNIPEDPAVIHVDGRRMWRVLENVFGNAAKYAMPGTRVYADLILTEDKVSFSLKNVSEQQLNITADELTERFIRGDLSRSTEGSGLGLSIAKSLTTMQGGEFELYLDGDLFRVNISFERVR